VPSTFADQLDAADQVLEGAGHLALCLGSGISRRKLPLLAELIAAAFCHLPATAAARAVFEGFSQQHVFHLRLQEKGMAVSNPCTLDEFCGLDEQVQTELCQTLVQTYGDVFRELQVVYGSKQGMLGAVDFGRFKNADPDVSHFFIAFLLIEGRISRVLTTNWDMLIEKALAISTSKPAEQTLSVALDQPSWLDRLNGPQVILAKVHGCATQFPLSCEHIVITTGDLQAAAAGGWRQDAVRDFLSGRVLFCGYSGSDYTLMVPAKVIEELRQSHALPAAQYFVAEDKDLSAGARQLNGDQPNRHLRMYANDMFSSLYFAFLRKRFKQAIETAEQQTQPERAFPKWNDTAWNDALGRLRTLMDVELPTMLDSIIGVPGSRGYDDFVAGIPVRLSELREMFLEGRVQHPKLYQPFRFDPIKDVVLLTVLAALVELGAASGFSLSMNGDVAGVTITESTGVVRTICLVYGTYAPAVVPMVNAYLSDVEATIGTLPTFEVLIVPCSQYKIGSFPDFAPDPVLSKPLPGVPAAKRTFVDPDVLFDSVDFGDLMSKLRAELGV
jgi:hypothetical protein